MGMHKDQDPMLDRIANGRTDLVFDFLASGQPATSRDAGGASLISTCAYFGDVSAIRFLISQGERLESLGPNLGLGSAAFHGHWQLCELLLEQGADANGTDPATGETALHAALCTANRPGCGLAVKVLVAAGADPDRATTPGAETGGFMRDCRTRGETALHRAAAFAERGDDPGASRCGRDTRCQGRERGYAAWLGELVHASRHGAQEALLRRVSRA